MAVIVLIILALVQGAAELLPVSSSAHVIVAAQLLGIDVKDAKFHFLMVMLHTGTMGAVIIFFFARWKALLTADKARRNAFLANVVVATCVTGAVGLLLKHFIEHYVLSGGPIEDLFAHQELIAAALVAVGVLIIFSAWRETQIKKKIALTYSGSFVIGFMQGLCLPFRGFSRSGATISTGLILGLPKELAEEFSFALAVVLTPAIIAREAWRIVKPAGGEAHFHFELSLFLPGLAGMVLSFLSGWLALKFLSSWMEKGRWSYFGYYCLALAGVVMMLKWKGGA